MARVRKVTRTVKVTNVRYLVVNTENGETAWAEKKLPGVFKSEKKAIETIGDVGKDMKVVRADVLCVENVKYSVPESFFLENATTENN